MNGEGGILGFLFGPFGWVSLGLILAAAEILLPGAFLMWLAAAAFATAATVFVHDGGIGYQLAVFAAWSALALIGSRRLKRTHPIPSDDPALNERGQRLLGASAVVVKAIEGGRGRVRLGDSEWIAEGPDTPAGARVRVLGADGAILKVDSLP